MHDVASVITNVCNGLKLLAYNEISTSDVVGSVLLYFVIIKIAQLWKKRNIDLSDCT